MLRRDLFEGRINTLEKLVDPNFVYLNHMFRYNSTFEKFSQILKVGCYDVTQQYELKEIWNYFKEKHYSYTEKKGNYIGHMETKSKLDFFPTSFAIQYISLPLSVPIKRITLDFMKRSTIKLLAKICCDGDVAGLVNVDSMKMYSKLVFAQRFDIIDEIYYIPVRDSYQDGRKYVVSDLFAGEGEWLNLYKKLFVHKKRLYTLCNEIEKNRFLKCKEKKFSHCIWGAYEDLKNKVPKKLVDLTLFNPPYGETDGERNVTRFLKMALRDNYFDGYSRIIMVINEKDYYSNKSLICENFEITNIFKFKDIEEERLHQICIIANFDKCSGYYLNKRLNDLERLEEGFEIENCNELEDLLARRTYNSDIFIGEKIINIYYDKLKIELNPNLYKSKLDSLSWKQLIQSSQVETFKGKRVKLAEKPRNLGAAANLISSGLINGEIEGEHKHCIAAGISEQEHKMFDETSGDIIVEKRSVPFLSVLSGGNIINITKQVADSVEIRDDQTVVVV